jgi:hypothetical protein
MVIRFFYSLRRRNTMQAPSIRRLLCLLACVVLVLNQSCASRQKAADASTSVTDGELRAIGQEVCREVRSEKMWQVAKSGILSSQRDAERYAADLQLGGYDDWRLPTKDELFTLHCIFFRGENNDCAMNSDGEFWTDSGEGKQSLGHWETDYLCGPIFKYVESIRTKGHVRAVRP